MRLLGREYLNRGTIARVRVSTGEGSGDHRQEGENDRRHDEENDHMCGKVRSSSSRALVGVGHFRCLVLRASSSLRAL